MTRKLLELSDHMLKRIKDFQHSRKKDSCIAAIRSLINTGLAVAVEEDKLVAERAKEGM